MMKTSPFNSVTMKDITKIVAKYYNLNYEEVFTKSRKTKFVAARQMSSYFIRKFIKSAFDDIGDFFNHGHCNVIHSCKTIENEAQVNKDKRKEISDIEFLIIELQSTRVYTSPNEEPEFCHPITYGTAV